MALTTMISMIGRMKNQTNTSLMTMRVEVAISDKGCHEKSYLEEEGNDDIGSQGAKSPMRRSGLVPGSDQNIKGVFFTKREAVLHFLEKKIASDCGSQLCFILVQKTME